jgi:hypothetical protein
MGPKALKLDGLYRTAGLNKEGSQVVAPAVIVTGRIAKLPEKAKPGKGGWNPSLSTAPHANQEAVEGDTKEG